MTSDLWSRTLHFNTTMKVREFRGELCGQNAPGLACLVFSKDLDGATTPRSTSSSYTLTEEDLERVGALDHLLESLPEFP